jgi:preprotein translocase subunit SecG
MTALYYLFLILFILTSVILCFLILIQESKSSGLGATFGGESSESLFGTSTPEVLKKITTYFAVIFLSGCVILSLWTSALGRPRQPSSTLNTEVIDS